MASALAITRPSRPHYGRCKLASHIEKTVLCGRYCFGVVYKSSRAASSELLLDQIDQLLGVRICRKC